MTDDRTEIEQSISEAREHVSRMPPTPGARELQARLASYLLRARSWPDAEPPSTDELRELRQAIGEVISLAKTATPTLGRRSEE
jgi:hypothetical protein